MTKEEANKILQEIRWDYDRLSDEYNKAARLLRDKALEVSKNYLGIEPGDKLIVRGKPAMISTIANPYFKLKPVIRVSFYKKDGTLRADTNEVYGDWEKAND